MVEALLDFLSEACRSKLCSREFPAETLSLRSRVKQFFPSLKGRQQEPHHRGYSNCAVGWRTERAVFHPQLQRLAEANRLFTEDVSSNLVARDNVSSPHFMRLGFGKRDRSDLDLEMI
ncbi:hypothetical protein CHARACLAT_027781 [Characodon lateralis]|uniref:Uncharacterized protein n=1 Tax=Characodon lateralis TaxID=208331 RepID=A0ABU7EPI6_9TELE|nr:hypothetical protein [Characodon lateralis]